MIQCRESASERWRNWTPAAIRADPLGFLGEALSAERALAALLEDIADALPGALRSAPASLAAMRLRQAATPWPPVEEITLQLSAERAGPSDPATLRAVAIARHEAAVVAGLALELADEMELLARHGRVSQPEALGFMLRACFDAVRRRLDWIETAILPGVFARLDADGLAAIGDALASAATRAAGGGTTAQRRSNLTRT